MVKNLFDIEPKNIQHIVVNDGCKDYSKNLLPEFESEQTFYNQNEKATDENYSAPDNEPLRRKNNLTLFDQLYNKKQQEYRIIVVHIERKDTTDRFVEEYRKYATQTQKLEKRDPFFHSQLIMLQRTCFYPF